jgi:hypothetical protein
MLFGGMIVAEFEYGTAVVELQFSDDQLPPD